MEKQEMENSQYRLRQLIGYLGILLPIVIYSTHGKLLSSISHYYYTSASIFFVGILFAFGLILIAYKGYPRNPNDKRPEKKERFTDAQLTSIAGILIIIAVVVPTCCTHSLDSELSHCHDGYYLFNDYLFGHDQKSTRNIVHLLSAGGFLSILGYMSLKKFTRSDNPDSQRKHGIYRRCGYLVLGSVGLLICLFVAEVIVSAITGDKEYSFNRHVHGYVFILETIAVWSFAIAWLIKGKVEKDLSQLKSRFFK